MPKKEKDKDMSKSFQLRHTPLASQINADGELLTRKQIIKQGIRENQARKNKNLSDDEDDDKFMDSKSSKKVLDMARIQRDDLQQEEKSITPNNKASAVKAMFHAQQNDMDSEDEYNYDVEEEDEEVEEEFVEMDEMGNVMGTGGGDITAEEEAMLAAFMDGGLQERRTLADIIMEKIQEKEEGVQAMKDDEDDGEEDFTVSPKVREVYSQVATILKTYTAGKLPKAFKVIPALSNWEEVVLLTRPDQWTPQATFAATRIFASNLNPKLAQRFFNLVLLQKVRDDIIEHKRLNYHYYMALKKAFFKPAAWFKGILLPLVQGKDCTLREAQIIGSVLAKVSVPVEHSAVALYKLAQMDYSIGCSIFITILLNKKYSLPFRVVDAVVNHFLKFTNETRELPVLWHTALLTFVQRYRQDITREQKNRMKELLNNQVHHQMTPEIRRELFLGKCRGETDSDYQKIQQAERDSMQM